MHLLVLLAVLAVLLAFLLPSIQRARTQSELATCKDHLRKIGASLSHYELLSGGCLPVSPTVENPHVELIRSLTRSTSMTDPRDYYCPSEHQASLQFSDERFKAGTIGYYYYSALNASTDPALSKFLRLDLPWPRKLNDKMSPDTWVMSDVWVSGQPTAHAGYRKGLNYLMLDGSVGFISESPRHSFH